jgi:hypothetical protein
MGDQNESSRERIPPSDAAAPSAAKCPFCLAGITSGESTQTCPSCRAVYHADCWAENGGCAVYGCSQVPATEARQSIEVPLSYWGQERKPCPSCGQEILAAAVRCRHCGTQFTSARPQDAGEFRAQTAIAEALPAARKRVITIFVLSVIPFSAPVAAMWGLLWRRTHTEELAALPPLHIALHRIGVVASIGLTTALIVMTILYATVRGP